MNRMDAFLWGSAGEKLTPKQIDRRRLEQALMAREASDTSPVGHWTAALNRGLQGYLSGKEANTLKKSEDLGRASGQDAIIAALGGGMSGRQAPQASPSMGGGSYSAPVEASAIRDGLIQRGLPEHIADGFVMNFADESGFNPGINEISPTVPGSRGGFGLYQLTGPRRTAYESFAAERGVDPSDTNAQLDWLMYELQGPESKAAQSIFSAQNAGEAGAAIVNDFLRPAPEHRTSRANRYMGYGGSAPAQSGPSSASLAPLLANEWAMEVGGPVINALLGQTMQNENAALEQQRRQADPMYQAQLEAAQLANQAARQPQTPKPIEVGGVLLDPNTYQPIFDSRTPAAAKAPETRELYDEATGQAYVAQWNPDNVSWDRVGGNKAPSGPLVNNVIGSGESEFNKEVGKGQAAAFLSMSETGRNSARNLEQIGRLEGLLAQGPSGASAALQSLAADYGIDFGQAGVLQGANALIQAMIPAQRPAGSGPMSDRDIEMFKSSLPRLINSPEGNALIIETLRGMAVYDQQIGAIAERAMLPSSDPQHLSRADANRLINEVASPLADFNKRTEGMVAADVTNAPPPPSVDPADWEFMTPEQRALFQ